MSPITAGPGRPTHRRVLALALPMTLANVTTPMLGFVGAAVIGRLGDAALLGAIALGAVIFDAIFWSFGALRMATAGLTAQAVGSRDGTEVDRILARALAAGVGIGLALSVLQWPIARIAFAISGASESVVSGLATYFHIRILSAPFVLASYGVLGSVLGRGRTDLGLLLQVAINLINIGLTLLLVLGLQLGLAGAALATVAAEAFGLGLGLIVLARLGCHPFRVPLRDLCDAGAIRRTLSVNVDVILRTLALITGIVLFSALGARQGDVVLAANSVLWNLFLIGGFFLDGFATAAETLCGQAVGARDAEAFEVASTLSLRWCLGFGIGVSLLSLAVGDGFIDFVTTNGPVRETARAYLWLAALAPFAAAAPFAYDGIYIGATWTRAMRNLMLCALAAYGVLLGIVQSLELGNTGLWLAFVGFLGARGLGQAIAFPGLARGTFPGGTVATARRGAGALSRILPARRRGRRRGPGGHRCGAGQFRFRTARIGATDGGLAVAAPPPDTAMPPLRGVADEPADHGSGHGSDRAADKGARDGAGADPQGRPALGRGDIRCADQGEGGQEKGA